jgi:NADH:ubiquinone oxidoreductase subunit 5 (subunit L)/multisubunit Na+/H+ antiporter MnhA subunit
MNAQTLLIFLAVPFLAAALMPLIAKAAKRLQGLLLLVATAAELTLAALLFGKSIHFVQPWLSWGPYTVDFSLRLDSFSSFIILAASAFAFLIAVYSAVFMKGHGSSRSFFAYMLLTLGLINGAVLANNLVLMLFFWEGLLVTLFTMILTGGVKASATALKALVLNGVADLCLMLGIAVLAGSAHTLAMDQINWALDGSSAGTLAFILMMIGAVAKAGSMPFHSWIPDAALDAPLPFMAFLPAALEKLAGIYLLARISLELFQFKPGSAMSLLMMIIGAVTLLFAVLMALIQKDYKRLLSYHAVSQVGYMILGIGTALPIGIVGGLFHMINHAMYKSTLFLTAGSVERQAGTTDLKQLGGLARKMPVTFACFAAAAAAISGVPPFNGFFSKELIFGATLETNVVFYIVAALGAFLTAASFLKLGHAVYLGKPGEKTAGVKEAPWPMLAPMIIIAAGCLLFGVWNALPLQKLIEPILGVRLAGESFAGHVDWLLTGISLGVLALALLNHLYGARRAGSGLGASDHIHYAPGLKQMYDLAERRRFDPYEIGMGIATAAARALMRLDRGIDWLFSDLTVKIAETASLGIRKAHTGSYWVYILWILGGLAAIAALAAALA